jgi:hypothetical protein
MGGQFMKGAGGRGGHGGTGHHGWHGSAGNGVGAVFNLGVKNSAKATTALTSKTSERVLAVANSGSGAALGLKVRSGKAPLTVNSTGLVKKLNADKLDGQDAAAILAATGEGGYVEFPVSNPFEVCTIAGFAGKTTIAKGSKRYLAKDMDAHTGTSSSMTVDMLWAGDKTATQWRWVGVNGDGHPMVGFQFIVN